MAITIEQHGQRVYLVGDTYAARDQIKQLGGHWDGDRRAWWVGAAKAAQAEALVAGLASAPAPKAGPGDDTRVKAKVSYKGRTYYVIAESADRARLTVLDGSLDFWADKAACELVKEYHGRPERGAYGRETGRTVYTTLGSIRRFIESQKAAESRGEPACGCCGKRGPLVHDLEDGMMKCRACCDMPAD